MIEAKHLYAAKMMAMEQQNGGGNVQA